MGMNEDKGLKCRFCGEEGLQWAPSSPGKFRLADRSGVFHDCPKFVRQIPTGGVVTGPPMLRRSRPSGVGALVGELKGWLRDWEATLDDDAREALEDVLASYVANGGKG